jgi:predicted NUDIX family phosphoesterase
MYHPNNGNIFQIHGYGESTTTWSRSTNVWYHSAWTKSSDVNTFYVNGVNIGSESAPNSYDLTNDDRFSIGVSAHYGALTYFAHAKFADVSFYDEGLTENDIINLMKKISIPTDYNSVVGWWQFNGNGEDSSGQGRHLDEVGGSVTYANVLKNNK